MAWVFRGVSRWHDNGETSEPCPECGWFLRWVEGDGAGRGSGWAKTLKCVKSKGGCGFVKGSVRIERKARIAAVREFRP